MLTATRPVLRACIEASCSARFVPVVSGRCRDPELLLKIRRVVPGRLLEAGFAFAHPTWAAAAEDLVARRR